MTGITLRSNETIAAPIVSVIVITYNQDLASLIDTLDSIIVQEGVPFEVIVCDDGSEEQFKDQLRHYFDVKGFSQYRLVFHDQNRGTVSNYYSGLRIAKGKYSKLLSPGDSLTERNILYKWVRFLEENHAEWSFSDTYYYRNDNGKKKVVIQAKAVPQIIRPYLNHDRSRCIWNYVALKDIANGAAIIGLTRLQIIFCKKIKDKGIKYCEDYIYYLMSFNGIVGSYFPEVAVCYECSSGISKSGSRIWGERLAEDTKKCLQLMIDEKGKIDCQKKMVKAQILNSKTNKIYKLFIRGKLIYWFKCRFIPRLTPIPKDW